MNKTVRIILLLVLLFYGQAVAAPILDPTHIQEATLDNGLRVIVKQEPYWPVVAIGLVIKAGSVDETDENAGVAHMIEHLLFEDAEDGSALGPWIEDMGGYVNASTWRDFTQVTVAVASEFLPEVLPRLAQSVFAAQFTEEQVARQRQIIAREMADRYALVDTLLDKLIWDLAFTVHRYKYPVPGTADSVAGLTSDMVNEFHRIHYQPSNAALLAVGDVAADEFTQLAESSFGEYQSLAVAAGYPPRPRSPVEPPQTGVRPKVELMGTQATFVQLAWHAPGVATKPEVCAMDLAYTILGAGRRGWLEKHVCREKQLAITCAVQFLTQRDPGLFIITAVTAPDKELAARQASLEEVEQLRAAPVSDQTLQEAKRLLYADYAFTNEAYTDQVDTLVFYEAIDSYRFATEYIELVNQVTAADLQAVVSKYLGPDNCSRLIIRPKESAEGTQEAWRQ